MCSSLAGEVRVTLIKRVHLEDGTFKAENWEFGFRISNFGFESVLIGTGGFAGSAAASFVTACPTFARSPS
jgi:hypothetical protein